MIKNTREVWITEALAVSDWLKNSHEPEHEKSDPILHRFRLDNTLDQPQTVIEWESDMREREREKWETR